MAKKVTKTDRRTNAPTSSSSMKTTTKTRTGRTTTTAKTPATKAMDSVDDREPIKRREDGDRRQADRRTEQQPIADDRRATKRRTVQRRRQIDPTTCERDYSTEEIEFMHAIDQFKRDSGRNFPTCQDVLDVIGGLGYRKVSGV